MHRFKRPIPKPSVSSLPFLESLLRKIGGEMDCCRGKNQNDCIDSCASAEKMKNGNCKNSKGFALDALPVPVGLTNKVFFVSFFSSSYFLMKRWREKSRTATPLLLLTLWELVAIVTQLASFIYLVGFFGIDYV